MRNTRGRPMKCKICFTPTDDKHPIKLKHDRVFLCEDCWQKLKALFEQGNENNDDQGT